MKKTDKILWHAKVGKSFFRILERVGESFNFFVFDRGNSVSALIHLTDLDQIIFIRQYRGGTDKVEIELPAGMCDEDEDPKVAVIREVMEETGYAYRFIEHVYHLVMSPGGCTEEHDIFYIATTSKMKKGVGGGVKEENEELEVMYVDADQAISMLHFGEIEDAKTVIALQWFENQRR